MQLVSKQKQGNDWDVGQHRESSIPNSPHVPFSSECSVRTAWDKEDKETAAQ